MAAKIRRARSMRSRDLNKPIGVCAYQLQNALPMEIKGSLPTIEELEAQLDSVSVETKDQDFQSP